jgi:alkanesulfonate monooxygenase SsuD/methylene tetrahydromethanopterin reductase-like flavin-dependent oxidoreductase (luciferase family)
MLTTPGVLPDRIAMYNANTLKIGVFGANCSSSRTATMVPERWTASWPDCLALAKMADAAGIDFMLPIGRWKGYGGETDFHGTTLETVTWACGLLAATSQITVFGTVHAPLFHPLIAAKEFVTADHIGAGRFGLNIVAGWNEGEFEMFGVTQRAHDDRYEFAEEWLAVVKRAWGTEEQFDFKGQFFDLRGVRAKPKPCGGTRPLIMNAGSSKAGQAFALRNCDAFFTATGASRASLEGALIRQGDRGLYHRAGDLPADPAASRGLSPSRQRRECRLGRDRAHAGVARHHTAEHPGGGLCGQAEVLRVAFDRRLSLRRHAGPDRRGTRRDQPQRRARHRAVLRQLSRRAAIFSRRGAAAARPPGGARSALAARSDHGAGFRDHATKTDRVARGRDITPP